VRKKEKISVSGIKLIISEFDYLRYKEGIITERLRLIINFIIERLKERFPQLKDLNSFLLRKTKRVGENKTFLLVDFPTTTVSLEETVEDRIIILQ